MKKDNFRKNLKYILKNSWDVLPGINEFQWGRNAIKTGNILYSNSSEKSPSSLKIFGRAFLTSIYFTCGMMTFFTNSLNPKEWNRQVGERYENIQEQIKYQNKIDSTYQSIFQEAKTTEDSLEIAKENNISYKLILNPSFKDKERIVKTLESKANN
jgi:hypothetical protein